MHVPIDPHPVTAGRAAVDPANDGTPERIYERRWALAALDAAVGRVEAKYARTGKRAAFETLKLSIHGDDRLDYEDLARALGRSKGATRVAVHRLRRHVAASLRATLAETVADEREVDDELRFLKAVLNRT
jgi:RNA polymerase sigma-70 factor (ECF subfamily)